MLKQARLVALSSLLILAPLTSIAYADSSPQAQPHDWEKLFKEDLTTFYLDKASVKSEGLKKTFWLQVMVENQEELSIKPLEEVRIQQIIDCEKQVVSEPIAWENRNEDGKLIESGQRPKDVIEWMPFEQLDGSDELKTRLCPAS